MYRVKYIYTIPQIHLSSFLCIYSFLCTFIYYETVLAPYKTTDYLETVSKLSCLEFIKLLQIFKKQAAVGVWSHLLHIQLQCSPFIYFLLYCLQQQSLEFPLGQALSLWYKTQHCLRVLYTMTVKGTKRDLLAIESCMFYVVHVKDQLGTRVENQQQLSIPVKYNSNK